jgi:uracil phosphoribosyltransferase
MIHDLSLSPSALNLYLGELRSVEHQSDPMRFRKNLERCSMLIGYEISKHLHYSEEEVETPLGIADIKTLGTQPVIASIMRAGLPMHQGLLEVFDRAGNAFVSAYRKHHKDGTFTIKVEYVSCPTMENRPLILVDPMIATGSSIIKTLEALKPYGQPGEVYIASIIASREGLEYVDRLLPEAQIYVGGIDEELTARAYIVPGLGDAGDLAYGPKIQE